MGATRQVIIVGGGPVGVGLAIDLAQRGVSCTLVERRVGMHNIPKGQNLTQRTLEHFYFWGCVEEVRAQRLLPPEVPSAGIVAYRSLTNEHWHSFEGREIVAPYYFQKNDRLPQYCFENVLRKRMAKLPLIEARFGWAAQTIAQDEHGVCVGVVHEAGGGARETLEADYVIGCDGAHSVVREQAGIRREGTDFDQPMVLAVFHSREFSEGLGKRFPVHSTYRVMEPALNGYWQFFGRVDAQEGFFFHSPVPVNTTRDNYDFAALLHRVAGFEFPCRFEYVGFWDLRVAVAEKYRAGRVFIAGDAAHSHPPYGGFGVNNGLEDAANLAWKLAGRLNGWAGEALLTSYDLERRPVFKQVGEEFITARIKWEGEVINRHDPKQNPTAFAQAWAELKTGAGPIVANFEPNYEGSPIVFGPSGGVTGARGEYMFKARAGHHLAPRILTSGRNVFQELGGSFVLLALDAPVETVAKFESAALARKVPLRVIRDTLADGRQDYEARFVLVRPDQYVAWVGDAEPADADAIICRAAGLDAA
ncbi:MAG TPA: FAD-dependent monooxygenase [Xanthobacteraceae bacterium]|nr:FAD-dependent monooxygenase [Xanthobacteraceae bacterium]